jgi:cytochrome c oxidase accessory protein FixG
VFLEGVYRRVERLLEGPRERRLRLERTGLTGGALARRIAKHVLFVLVSLLLAHVALSFFVSGRALVDMMHRSPAQHPEAFAWMAAITAGLYFNFAWFREQMCTILCPYGRLQSALQDGDSMVIGYDARRGEPRGKAKTRVSLPVVANQAERKTGDCVDCRRCVVVCPAGIDIRLGLQMECIGCAQCVDACDEIMTKLGRPRGLVRYDSMNGLEGKPRRVVRGRLIAYGSFFAAAILGVTASLVLRTPFEANVLRIQGAPYVLEQGTVRNQFELHLVNKNPEPSTFVISPSTTTGVKADFIVPQKEVRLEPLASIRLPMFVSVDRANYHGPFQIAIDVNDQLAHKKRVNARFLGPQ